MLQRGSKSRIDRDIDKQKAAFTTTINSTLNAEKLVNLGSQTSLVAFIHRNASL